MTWLLLWIYWFSLSVILLLFFNENLRSANKFYQKENRHAEGLNFVRKIINFQKSDHKDRSLISDQKFSKSWKLIFCVKNTKSSVLNHQFSKSITAGNRSLICDQRFIGSIMTRLLHVKSKRFWKLSVFEDLKRRISSESSFRTSCNLLAYESVSSRQQTF